MFPPFPRLTNSWLLTTAVGCCLEYCLRRTKRTVVVVDAEKNTPTYCLGCCQSDDSRAYSEKEQSIKKPSHKYQRLPCLPGLSFGKKKRCCTANIPRSLIIAEAIPHEGHTPRQHYTKTSHVNNRVCICYCLIKKHKINDDCCSRDGVYAGRGSSCAVLVAFSMAASSP